METKEEPLYNNLLFDKSQCFILPKAIVWNFFVDRLVEQMLPKMKLKGPKKNEVIFQQPLTWSLIYFFKVLKVSTPILPGLFAIMFPNTTEITFNTTEEITTFFSPRCAKQFIASWATLQPPLVIRLKIDAETAEEKVTARFTYIVVNSNGVVQ